MCVVIVCVKGKVDEFEDVDLEEIELDVMECMEKIMDVIVNDFSIVCMGWVNVVVLD